MRRLATQLTLALMLLGASGTATKAIEQVMTDSIKTLYFEDLAYPLNARLSQTQGVVVVRGQLTDDGRVTSVTAISGAKDLIADCVSNLKKWRFQPNAAHEVVIVYRFKFEGLCNLPCRSQFRFEPPNFVSVTMGTAVIDHPGQ